ncbi:unnamed protein product [Lactuca virosa]|uniref:Uncharacterized protein n=1 Tax=Lactuca virosa TaxID=75947 RepID=A0AAU9LW65_9ASTR|nr:unnamed protein product [Lactuca virosa]
MLMILARVRFGLRTIRRRRMDLVPCSKYHCLLLLVPLQKHPRHVLYPLQSVDRRRGHRCSTRTFHRHHQTQDSSSQFESIIPIDLCGAGWYVFDQNKRQKGFQMKPLSIR